MKITLARFGLVLLGLATLTGCNATDSLQSQSALENPSGPSSGPTVTPTPTPTVTPSPTSSSGAMAGLHVANGFLVNGAGATVRLHGADHSYTEDSCTYQGGTFSDGHLTQTDLTVMKNVWHMNAVRVPLNESCLLGINGAFFSGSAYQTALMNYVNLITSNGMAVIVDLHWTGPGTQLANVGQLNMADTDHSPAFWTKVASMFASKGAGDTSSNSMVIFDLFNEPYVADWSCWLKGVNAGGAICPVQDGSGKTFPGTGGSGIAGVATLLKAVRATGAQNVVMIGGIAYASDLTSWVTYVKEIPNLPAPNNGLTLANVMASIHIYDFDYLPNGMRCGSSTGQQIADGSGLTQVLAAGFPFINGETGNQTDNSASWWTGNTGWLTYIDSKDMGYTAWSWNTDTAPTLLTKFPTSAGETVSTYTTTMGQTFYEHLTATFP